MIIVRSLLLLLLWAGAIVAPVHAEESDALRAARNALAAAEAEREVQPLGEAMALERLARELIMVRRLAEGEEVLRGALAIRQREQGPTHADVAATGWRLANSLMGQRRYEEAEVWLERAIAIEREQSGPRHPSFGRMLFDLGSVYYFDRRYEQAIEMFKSVIALFDENDTWPVSLDRLSMLERLGESQLAAGQPSESVRTLERWLTELEDDNADSIGITGGLEVLGRAYRMLERFDDADRVFERKLSIYQATFGESDLIVLVALRSEATDDVLAGRHARAESLYRRALTLLNASDPVDPVEQAWLMRTLGNTIASEEPNDEAVALLAEALDLMRQALEADDPELAQFLVPLAETYTKRNQHEVAIALFLEALPMVTPEEASRLEREVESNRYQLRLARLGPQTPPEWFAKDGIIHDSGPYMPQRFDMVVDRMDRSNAGHGGRRVPYWDLGSYAHDAGASTLLVREAGDDDLCIAVLTIRPDLYVFLERDSTAQGILLNFTDPDTVAEVWQDCRIALGPDG